MEYKSSYDRINNVKDIDYISREICKDYNFGAFKKNEIIEIGYEDFNYCLFTETGEYVVKIFNVERDDSSCERLIDILLKSYNNGIMVPKIYSCAGEYIYKIDVAGISLRLFVMQYAGKDFWTLNRDLKASELKRVAKIAATINSIDYDVSGDFYDEWAVTNLAKEYEKKKMCLSKDDFSLVSDIVADFLKLNLADFKHSYIHGDMIKANLLLDDYNQIYVVDFSGFNYLPRIVEITVILLGLCLTDKKETTIKKMNRFLKYYNDYSPIEDYELESLSLMLNSLAAVFIIQASFIKKNMGDYVENEYWLSEGRRYLKMGINPDDFCLKKRNK